MMEDTPKRFKNASNAFYTRDLFYETAIGDKANVLYTLKEEDFQGLPSLYRLYMESNDPTEYSFAVKHLGGWAHWEALSKASFFQPYITAWRRELEIRARSRALASIMEKASGTSREAFQAAKFVAEGFGEKSRGRGRPSKQEVKEAAQEIASHKSRIDEDFARLMN